MAKFPTNIEIVTRFLKQDEMKAWAARQGLSVLYIRNDNRVWISDRRDGEGGMFNMFDFLCSNDPREFFTKNF